MEKEATGGALIISPVAHAGFSRQNEYTRSASFIYADARYDHTVEKMGRRDGFRSSISILLECSNLLRQAL